jgi:hypothetical protein
MKKSLTIMVLAATALVGVAGAASAQGYPYQNNARANYAMSQSQQRDWRYFAGVDGTADHGNASPPAGGIGRVNSHTQE